MTAAVSEDADRETQSEEQVGTQHEFQCVNTHSLHQTDIGTTPQHNKHFLPTHQIYCIACQLMALVRLAAFSCKRFQLKDLRQLQQRVFKVPEVGV